MDVVKRFSWSQVGRESPLYRDNRLREWIGTQRRLVCALASQLGLQWDALWLNRMSWAAKEKEIGVLVARNSDADDEDKRLRSLQGSFSQLIDIIKADLLVYTEMVKLPLVLGSDVCIESEAPSESEAAAAPSVDYPQALKELVSIAKDPSVGEDLLLDLLHIVRLSIYSVEPSGPEILLDSEISEAFQRFLSGKSVQKNYGAGARTVTWLQNKYDMAGCTSMAMRLMSHANEEVQAEALRLLLTLLQAGNSRTQRSALSFLATGEASFLLCSRNCRVLLLLSALASAVVRRMSWACVATASRQQKWFDTCSKVLHAATKHLHKASKRQKQSLSKATKEANFESGSAVPQRLGVTSASGLAALIEDEQGGTSRAMTVLRMLELLCKNQVAAPGLRSCHRHSMIIISLVAVVLWRRWECRCLTRDGGSAWSGRTS